LIISQLQFVPVAIDLYFFPHTGGTLQRFTESHIDSS
jgi:hypothetical protein